MTDIYTPSTSPISSMSSKPLDPTRCKAGVWGNERWASYAQCSRKAGADGWCKQHHPDAQKKRDAAADEKYQASLRKSAMGWYGEQFMAALIKIRDGDNDPRSTAAEALAGVSYSENDKP